MKQAGASLQLCVHNLLNPPQDFLLPSQTLTGNKLEVVGEILRVVVSCVCSPLSGEAVLGGFLLSGVWSLGHNLNWRVQSSTERGPVAHVPELGLPLHYGLQSTWPLTEPMRRSAVLAKTLSDTWAKLFTARLLISLLFWSLQHGDTLIINCLLITIKRSW